MKSKLIITSILILLFALPLVTAGSAVSIKLSMTNGSIDLSNEGIQGQSYIQMEGNSALNFQNSEEWNNYKNIIWMDAEKASVRDVTPETDNRFKDIKNLNGTFVTERSFEITSEEEKETEENITTITTTFNKRFGVANNIEITFDSGFIDMNRILVAGPKNHPMMSNMVGNFTAPVYLDYRFTAYGNQTWQNVEHLTNVEGEGKA